MMLLYNATIVNEGRRYVGHVLISGQRIAAVGKGKPSVRTLRSCGQAIDLKGSLLLPGVIDEHVHFREPGMTRKADMASESRAALMGGVTSFMDMPNNVPLTTTPETLEAKFERAAQVSPINYSFYIGATNDNVQLLTTPGAIDYRHVCGIKAFLGSSTGGMLLSDERAKNELFANSGTIIAVHSEDESIISHNRQLAVERWGQDPPLFAHGLIRSEGACQQSTLSAVQLAMKLGTRLHVCHVSTASEVQLLAWANTGLGHKRITSEAVLAHLLFTEQDYGRLGARIKCNPAVKTAADREALRRAVRLGIIDTLATDHAPHLLAEKLGGCTRAASGMPMVQFSLVTALELFSPELVAEKMCHAPARIFGIEDRGFLRPGYFADLAVVSALPPEGHVITDQDVASKCGWTPLQGTTVHHQVQATVVNGQLAYCDGQVIDSVRGMALSFRH